MHIFSRLAVACCLLTSVVACDSRNDKDIQQLDDAKDARIGVVTGSTGEAITKQLFPDADIKSFDDPMDAVGAVLVGQLDATVTGRPVATLIVRNNPELALLDEPLQPENTSIAVRKDSLELLAQVNKILGDLKADGTLASMQARWFKTTSGPYEEPILDLPTQGEPLRIGVTATREPFNFVDANGRVTGHDGELAYRISVALGRPLEFSNMRFAALIPALQAGKIDMIVTGMTATEERAKFVSFSDSYYENAQVMLVRKPGGGSPAKPEADAPIQIRSNDDLAGIQVGALLGSIQDKYVREQYPTAEVMQYNNAADLVMAVEGQRVDAGVADRDFLNEVLADNAQLAMLETPLFSMDIGAGFEKDNQALREAFDGFLAGIREDGTYDDMIQRWFVRKERTMPTLPEDGSAGTLTIGTAAFGFPYGAIQDGEFAGFDIELARRFAASQGKQAEFLQMDFGGLIAAQVAGKVDMLVTGMFITPERKERIDFSDPYYNTEIRVFALKQNMGARPAAAPGKPKLTSIGDIHGRRVGVVLGSAQDVYLRKAYPTAEVLQFDHGADLILGLTTDRIDMAVADRDFVRENVATQAQLGVLDEPLFASEVAAGFSKSNPALRADFNAFLANIRADGTYQDMVDRWFKRGERVMPELPAEGSAGVLRVGTSAGGYPFGAVFNGEFSGFDIELARRFAASQGKRAQFSHMQFASLIAALTSGKVDMLTTSMFITEERKERIDFSDPYYATDTRVFALKQNIEQRPKPSGNKLATPADLHGRRIGVMLGSAQEGFATKTFTDSEILQYRTPADLVLAVHDGKVDAGFMDGDPLREILAQQPGFAILGEPLFVSEAGAGFSKASIELRDQFNQFLAGIRADGTYDDMIERWIRGKDSTMPTLPEKPRQGKLTVATNDFGLPFVAVQDGRLVGFDMELAERFAHFLGREVELLNMDWSAVIAATVSGKADVGLGCMFITEERKQNILFSDPYYEAESLAIVLASRAAGADAEAAQPPTAPSWLDGLKASIESNLVRERRYLLIWDGLKTTVVISIFATIFGTLLGGLVCMMRMSSSRWLQWPARSYIAVLRGTPVLVLLMLIFYVVFASVDISPVFVAVVAFGMNFAAYVAEIYRSGIQSIDRGQSEAGIAMGFSRFRTFLYVILPQTVQRILPVYKGEFISLVKMTSIVGYIAVQDLTKASDIIRSRTFDAFFPLVMVAILYFVIAWVLIQALEYLERRTDPKQRRRKAVSK
ncbi:MAG: ABC transporter permease subunit [Steroidobacteraceae bacterium]